MEENEVMYIGEVGEIRETIRELDFSGISDEYLPYKEKYEALPISDKLWLQDTIKRITGHDNFGYNFTIIDKWNEESEAKKYDIAREIARSEIKGKSDEYELGIKTKRYYDDLRRMKSNINPSKSEKIISYCKNLLLTPNLLYYGEGKIYSIDLNEYKTSVYEEFCKSDEALLFKNSYEYLLGYQKFLETKFPNFKARTNIIKTKYAKIKLDGSYIMLYNTKSYSNIFNYINYLINELYNINANEKSLKYKNLLMNHLEELRYNEIE